MERYLFDRKRFQLRKTILDGLSYYIIWKALNDEYKSGIQNGSFKSDFSWRYRGFIAPSRNALLWSTLMQLSKAYDTHPRSISFISLLGIVRNNIDELAPYATQDELENIQARIYQNRNLIDRLRRYRNQRLVHLDSELTESMEFPAEQVHAMVDETKSILNKLSYSCEGKHEDYDEMMKDVQLHTAEILKIIHGVHTNS